MAVFNAPNKLPNHVWRLGRDGPWLFERQSGRAKGWECTLPETNSHFAPENGWLEYDRFLLGPGLFSGANCYVSFRGLFPCICMVCMVRNGQKATSFNGLGFVYGTSKRQRAFFTHTGLSEWRIFCCLSMIIRLSLQVFGSPAIL